ncbi:ABC transporter ATP-binding protein [Demequina aurantiaca]|uniref:ABC transporter ATP-binding protein n=1 Tax=Demequina aurantiaca TaxID=676200 RepID=UPI0007822A78|nr:ABC transporter ATP-binding protein [Demequina aurantiaca]
MITTRGLSKSYGSALVLDGVDLAVPQGSVYGLAGPNGAGKTTLINIVAGLRAATSGDVDVQTSSDQIAVLSDTPRFEPWLTGREVVTLALSLATGATNYDRVDEVLGQTGLSDAASRRCAGYSRGMLQRLGIASTLVAGPSLILLDEPASALDPQGRREILNLIADLRGQATVLFSSHILGDVQEVCDTVGILHHGSLLFQGPLDELLVGNAVPRYLVKVSGGAAAIARELDREDWVRTASAEGDGRVTLEVTTTADAQQHLPAALAKASAIVVSLGPEEMSLERAFLELTS